MSPEGKPRHTLCRLKCNSILTLANLILLQCVLFTKNKMEFKVNKSINEHYFDTSTSSI